MVRNFAKKHKTLSKIFLALILLISALVILLSSVYIDISDRIPALLEEVRPNLYGDMKVKAASIKFLPSPTLRLSGFSLTNAEGDLVNSVVVKVRVKLIPLFSKKYRVEMLTLQGADILFWRYADGTINFSKIVKIKKLDIKINGVSIRGGNLRVKDDLPVFGASLDFTSLDFDIRRRGDGFKFGLTAWGDGGRSITLSGESAPNTSASAGVAETKGDDTTVTIEGGAGNNKKEKTTVSGRVRAEGFDLTLLAPYLEEKYTGLNLAGAVALDGDYSMGNGFSYTGKVDYKRLRVPTPWLKTREIESSSGSAAVVVNWDGHANRLSVKDARLSVGELELIGNVDYGGPVDAPSVTLKFSSSPAGYDKVKELIPLTNMPEKVAARLEAFKVTTGKVEVKNLSISGPINELRKPGGLLKNKETFTMELGFTGTDFTYPGFDKEFTDISGTLELGGRDMRMEGFKGSYGTATLDGLRGEVLGMGKKASYGIWLDGSFTAEDTMGELKKHVKALRKIEATGRVLVNFEIKGSKGSGRRASGKFILDGNRIKHEIVPLHFSEATGEVAFEPDKISFNKLTAFHGASSVILEGDINFKGKKKTPELKLKTSGDMTEDTLVVLMRKKGVKVALPSYDGTARFDILFQGGPGALNVDSSVDFKDTNVSYLNLLNKRHGYPTSYKSKILYKKDGLKIDFLELRFGSSSLRARGSSSRDLLEYKLDISPTKLKIADIDDVSPYLIPDDGAGGTLSLSLSLDKKRDEDGARINGWLSVKDGAVKTVFLKHDLKEVMLDATLNGKDGLVTLEKFKTGNTTLSASIDIVDIPAKKVNFELSSPQAVISDLIPIWKNKKTSSGKRSQPNGTGEIIIKKGDIFGYPITGLRSSVNFDKDYVHLNKLSFASNGGIINGDLSYMKDPAEELLYKTDLNVKNVDLDKMLLSLGVQEESKTLTGILDSKINLNVKRGVPFSKGMNGEVELDIRDGKLWKFVVMSKIFSIVNIISINALFEKGLPYDHISGSFKVKDGLFSTEDFIFESQSLRMSAFGDVDAVRKTIQAKLGFHPFVTVDKIITSIPLAGWIIGGKEKSFLSMYYEVKGPLKDPDVYPVPVKTIGKGIFGILQRTLETPVKILTPEKKEDGGPGAAEDGSGGDLPVVEGAP